MNVATTRNQETNATPTIFSTASNVIFTISESYFQTVKNHFVGLKNRYSDNAFRNYFSKKPFNTLATATLPVGTQIIYSNIDSIYRNIPARAFNSSILLYM